MEDYLNELCPRCGSKRTVLKVWKDNIKTFNGTSEVEFTKIVCTNVTCQNAFEKQRRADAKKKKEELKKKEERENLRKLTKSKNSKSAKKPKK